MKKLEEIGKNNNFEVPDGYFDRLPDRVMARVQQKSSSEHPIFSYFWKLAFPVTAIIALVAGVYLFQQEDPTSEELLATVETDDLIAYIEEADFTTDDVLNTYELSEYDIMEIENQAYLLESSQNVEELIEVYEAWE